jgi:hypothetical protein
MARQALIFGSSRTEEGRNALMVMSNSSSQIRCGA